MKKFLIDYIIDNKKYFYWLHLPKRLHLFWELNFVRRIFSIKSDFVPYLVKKQFSSHKTNHESKEKNSGVNFVHNSSKAKNPKLQDYIKVDKLTQLISRLSTTKIDQDLLSCYVFLQNEGFCHRANNLSVYAEANRQVSTGLIKPYLNIHQ